MAAPARRLAIKLDVDDEDALKGVRDLDRALDGIERTAKEAGEAFDKATEKLADGFKAGERVSRDVEQAFRKLGVRSEQTADKQRRAYVAAFEKIRDSGRASADEIRRAQAALENQLQRIDRQAKGAAGSFDQMRTEGVRAGSSLTRVLQGAVVAVSLLAIAAGARRATRELIDLVGSAARAGDEAAKLGQRLGLTAEQVQVYQFAAERSGATSEQFAGGVRFLNTQLGNALRGSKEAAARFSELGISIVDAGGGIVPTSQLIVQIADALAAIPDPTQRAIQAARLFGEEAGPALVPLLAAGKQGIVDLADQAVRLGVVMSNQAAADAEKFQDALTNLEASATGLRNAFAGPLSDPLTEVFEALTVAAIKLQPVLREFSSTAVVPLIDDFTNLVESGRLVDEVTAALERLTRGEGPVADILKLTKAVGLLAGALLAVVDVGQTVGLTLAAIFAVATGADPAIAFDELRKRAINPLDRFAGGGRVEGPGTGTSDSVLARLSDGEYVIRTRAVQAYGLRLFDQLNGLRLDPGRLPGYASGGLVAPAVPGLAPLAGMLPASEGAGGGNTVNLTIDGQTFTMRAGDDVARSLEHKLRRQSIATTIRAPSWVR